MKFDKDFYATHIKKMFQSRRYSHYQISLDDYRKIIKYWAIYLYIFIGCIAGLSLIFSIINHQPLMVYGEVLIIYVSALYFLFATQFSLKYFLHPADIVHFKQRKDIILKLRKYAVVHGLYIQLMSWIVIYVLFSPLYFYIFPHKMDYYLGLYFFSASFSLVTSIIKKESMFYLREKSGTAFRICYVIIIVVLKVWFISIFCFADILYIFVGMIINMLMFFYIYNWGTHIIMPTLSYLVLHDSRRSVLSAVIVGDLPEQQHAIKPYQSKLFFSKCINSFFINGKRQFVLPYVIIKHLLQTTSYKVMLVYLYTISGIGLFLIEHIHQFIMLAIVTLYISFLIHKQHMEYFYAHTLMKTNVKQGFNKRKLDVKCTLVMTTPCILIMFIIYNFI